MFYMYTGNLLAPIWFVSTVTILRHLKTVTRSDEDLDPAVERIWYADWRFDLPCYAVIFVEALLWVWALCMFSFEGPSELWLFRAKPESTRAYILFLVTFGYFTGLAEIAGHELLHRKECYNKVIGTSAYTRVFMTHFLDEHVKGHHK